MAQEPVTLGPKQGICRQGHFYGDLECLAWEAQNTDEEAKKGREQMLQDAHFMLTRLATKCSHHLIRVLFPSVLSPVVERRSTQNNSIFLQSGHAAPGFPLAGTSAGSAPSLRPKRELASRSRGQRSIRDNMLPASEV